MRASGAAVLQPSRGMNPNQSQLRRLVLLRRHQKPAKEKLRAMVRLMMCPCQGVGKRRLLWRAGEQDAGCIRWF